MGGELRKLDEEFHDRTAVGYDAEVTSLFAPQHRLGLAPWIEKLPERVQEGWALDDGAGTGVVALLLASVCRRVAAVDHSARMLEIARGKAAQAGADNIHFVRVNCHHLPFAQASFRVVTVQGLLHHHGAVNWRLATAETVRVLAPGGVLYISEPCRETNPVARSLAFVVGTGIRLGRALAHPLRVLRRRRAALTSRAPAQEKVAEGPISAWELVRELRRLGLTVRTRYLTDIPAAVTLPVGWRTFLTRLVSAPLGRRRGDVLFVYATKPEAGSPDTSSSAAERRRDT